MTREEQIDYLLSTPYYPKKADLKRVHRIIKSNKTMPIGELVERIILIDKEFNGEPWNIRQILNQIIMITPKEDRHES